MIITLFILPNLINVLLFNTRLAVNYLYCAYSNNFLIIKEYTRKRQSLTKFLGPVFVHPSMLHPFFDLPPRRLLNSPAPVDTDNRPRFVNTFDILLISTELFIAAVFAPLVPGLIKFKRFGREIVQVIVFISFRNKIVDDDLV